MAMRISEAMVRGAGLNSSETHWHDHETHFSEEKTCTVTDLTVYLIPSKASTAWMLVDGHLPPDTMQNLGNGENTMKTGKSLTALAQQLETLRAESRDYVVPTEKLEAVSTGTDVKLEFTNGEKKAYNLNNWSHGQLSTYTNVPKAYYDRLKSENPNLLATNINHGLIMGAEKTAKRTESRMVRTVGNDIRALVSPSFRRLDSYDLLNETFPQLIDNGLKVESCELTERRLYLKALSPKLTGEIKKGDAVQYGLVISNSDVGAGSLKVEPLIYRLVCLNGMIASTAIKKYHVGSRIGGDDIQELLTDSTKELTDAAFWAQVRDVITASLRPEVFQSEIEKLQVAAGLKIENFDIPEVVELASKAVGVSGENLKQSMVAYLANGADGAGLTKWGLANAFTYVAQDDSVNYDQATELERAGAKIIELNKSQWQRIAC